MNEANALLLQHRYGEALAALLEVWRASREPRVATLIDLVSTRSASAQPIPGKSVGDRDDAWRAIAKQKQATDVPRLLAALWPTQWRDARPLLDLLERFPEDPRIAAHLVATVVDPPYTSGASEAFFKLVYFAIGKLADRRGIPALAKLADARAKEAIAAIEKRRVAPVDATALAVAEAYFAGDVERAGEDAARGAALLAAVYEAPDDDAPRAVYADWLVERGDPRGELIALQLARGAGVPTKRERELLNEHARTWAGELGQSFDARGLAFDRGFFAGGTYTATSAAPLRADPAARLVTHLDCWGTVINDLLPHLPSLRRLSTSPVLAAQLACPRLTELSIGNDDGLDTAVLGACIGYPALRSLKFYGSRFEWLLVAPVLDRIERLTIGGRLTRDFVEALLARSSSLREISLRRDDWIATLTRASPGDAFVECRLFYPHTSRFDVARSLVTELEILPAGLKRIVIDPGTQELGEERRAIVEPALARFTEAKIEVPWKTTQVLADEPTVHLHLSGRGLLDAALLPQIWNLLAEAGQRYDALVVGSGKALKPLGTDPLAKLSTWAANEKTADITLRHTERRDRALLSAHRSSSRFSNPAEKTTDIELVLRDDVAALPRWFARLVKLTDANWALCDVKRDRTFTFFDREPVPIGWLSLVPAAIAARYPFEKIAGDGVELLRHDGVTILVTAPTPGEATTERVAHVAARVQALA